MILSKCQYLFFAIVAEGKMLETRQSEFAQCIIIIVSFLRDMKDESISRTPDDMTWGRETTGT